MIITRSDGGGVSHSDCRLIKIRAILNEIPFFTQIVKLHDHEGCLTVYWESEPHKEEMQLLQNIWFLFHEYFEIDHKVVEWD